jgi:hypothetical protein
MLHGRRKHAAEVSWKEAEQKVYRRKQKTQQAFDEGKETRSE